MKPLEVQVIKAKRILLIRNLLSPEECKIFIQMMKDGIPEPVGQPSSSYRYCERIILNLNELATSLWMKIRTVMEEAGLLKITSTAETSCQGMWEADHLKKAFTLIQYKQGGHFSAHHDGVYETQENERSFWSLTMYLNDVDISQGGATKLLDPDISISSIQPSQGSALLFFQPKTLHAGEPLISGEKFLLRTDVMFQQKMDMKDRMTKEKQQAVNLYQQAVSLELEKEVNEAWHLYAKAFKIWPDIETFFSAEGNYVIN